MYKQGRISECCLNMSGSIWEGNEIEMVLKIQNVAVIFSCLVVNWYSIKENKKHHLLELKMTCDDNTQRADIVRTTYSYLLF